MDNMLLSENFGFCFLFILWIVIRTIWVYFTSDHGKNNFNRSLVIHLFAIYSSFVVSKLFFPINLIVTGQVACISPIMSINPYKDFLNIVNVNGKNIAIEIILNNIILFIPITLFLIILFSKYLNSITKVIVLSLVIGFGIEFFQFLQSIIIPSVSREVNFKDILIVILGGILGFVTFKIYMIFNKIFGWMKKKVVI